MYIFLFILIWFLVDTYVYLKGYDTWWWTHKTVEEKEIQRIKIERMRHDNP